MTLQIYKFGGASVKNAAGFRNVARICTSAINEPLVVVLSALGKTTNAMEGVVKSLFQEGTEAAQRHVDRIRSGHLVILDDLGLPHNIISSVFDNLSSSLANLKALSYDAAYDAIVSHGEICSTKILHALIDQSSTKLEWVDARTIVSTNDIHRDATVDWEATKAAIAKHVEPILLSGRSVITQGFIGGADGATTTLGREGSDYTAAIFGFCLDVSNVTIWKDVPGVLSGDPRDFENVVKLDRLSYREAIEMTYYGAKVIHPKTIKPLQNKGIQLNVRSFENTNEDGTVITQDVEVAYPPIVVIEKDQALLHISTHDFSFVAEHHMRVIFDRISHYRIKVNMMRNTAISFTVCISDVGERVEALIHDLSKEFNVVVDRNMELVTIRHHNNGDVNDIIGNRPVIFEERIKDTLQMVVRKGEGIKRKSN